jgi:hypothetical protein
MGDFNRTGKGYPFPYQYRVVGDPVGDTGADHTGTLPATVLLVRGVLSLRARGGWQGGWGRESRADVSLGYDQPLDILFFADEKYDFVRITSYQSGAVLSG